MAIIVRIDVDRPYGREPLYRHLLSRFSSDFYFPRTEAIGYLKELKGMLQLLGDAGARAHVFFRQCTLPSDSVMQMMEDGKHEFGLHLENSRSYESFREERLFLERYTGKKIVSFSKHGSGGAKFGRRHYAPYESERYVQWAAEADMAVFYGNLEDPTIPARAEGTRLTWFPSAFWLEPAWRDSGKFTVDWLLTQAGANDIVLLVHPENVLADPNLIKDFTRIISQLPSKIIN